MTPRIAILLDENTSSGATRYEARKGYFQGLRQAGNRTFRGFVAPGRDRRRLRDIKISL